MKEAIVDSKLYNRKAAANLPESYDSLYNEQGDERINTLGRGYYLQDVEEFEPYVDLWEVYLPRQRLVLTFSDDMLTGAVGGEIDGALRVQRWIGPDCGPYHLLGMIQGGDEEARLAAPEADEPDGAVQGERPGLWRGRR